MYTLEMIAIKCQRISRTREQQLNGLFYFVSLEKFPLKQRFEIYFKSAGNLHIFLYRSSQNSVDFA
jgi:hypothetical protein